LVVFDPHEQVELAFRLVEHELLGEREDEPATLAHTDGHHVPVELEARGGSGLRLEAMEPPTDVVRPAGFGCP
jgi:hypothetical protein